MSDVIRLYRSGPPMPRRKSHLMGVRRSRAQDRAWKTTRSIEADKAARATGKVEVTVKPITKPAVKSESKPRPPMCPKKVAAMNAVLAQAKAKRGGAAL